MLVLIIKWLCRIGSRPLSMAILQIVFREKVLRIKRSSANMTFFNYYTTIQGESSYEIKNLLIMIETHNTQKLFSMSFQWIIAQQNYVGAKWEINLFNRFTSHKRKLVSITKCCRDKCCQILHHLSNDNSCSCQKCLPDLTKTKVCAISKHSLLKWESISLG